jgi:adenosylcobinamide-GDP ribazoletransferase
MKKELLTLCAAFVFYTKLPCPFELQEVHFRHSARYFTLVGWVVGMFSGCAFLLAQYVFSTPVSVLFSLLLTVLLTGGMHEDGLADVCDGFGGGWSRQGILTIMKDPAIGVYGVLGIAFVFLFRFVALSEMIILQIPFVMIAGQAISRFFAITFMYTQEYVSDPDKSKSGSVVEKMSFLSILLAAICGLLPILLLKNYYIFLAIVPVFLVRWLLGLFFKKWIGGYTGDCLGATQQVCEVVFYLCILASPWKFF